MDWISDLFFEKAIKKEENTIDFDNFIHQAKNLEIIKSNPNCTTTTPGYLWNTITRANDYDIKDVYLSLYEYLVAKKVIVQSVGASSFFSADYTYTINQQEVKSLTLNGVPNMLKCFTINIEKLKDFLTNYKHNYMDEINVVRGGKSKKRKNQNKKKRQKNSYTIM